MSIIEFAVITSRTLYQYEDAMFDCRFLAHRRMIINCKGSIMDRSLFKNVLWNTTRSIWKHNER